MPMITSSISFSFKLGRMLKFCVLRRGKLYMNQCELKCGLNRNGLSAVVIRADARSLPEND